jgi:hypothetical protein
MSFSAHVGAYRTAAQKSRINPETRRAPPISGKLGDAGGVEILGEAAGLSVFHASDWSAHWFATPEGGDARARGRSLPARAAPPLFHTGARLESYRNPVPPYRIPGSGAHRDAP